MARSRLQSRGSIVVVVFLSLVICRPVFGQKITIGALAGASLTDDFRNTSFIYLDGTTQHTTNASQWFMFGATMDFAFADKVSVEVDAIRRRIRSTQLTILSKPLELPGITIRQLGPYLSDGFTWQVSVLGKYKLPGRTVKPFLEFGTSFLPQENRDQTGLTTGAGVEFPVGRARLAPTLRYTRWLTDNGLGAVHDQLQFVVGLHEASDSRRPVLLGRPLSLGFVVGASITKLLKDRSDPIFLSASTSDSHTPIAGVRVGVPVSADVSVEVDGLFRATHEIDGRLLSDGSISKSGSRSAFLTWQFPVLAKYKLPVSKVSPLVELGPAFRITAHTHSENYAHYGLAGGLGLSARVGEMSVSPTLRYTRWARDKKRFGQEPATGTRPNQLEVMVGFSF